MSSPAPADPPPPEQVHGGTCAIVGLPNVGKSTLLNRVLGRHLAAVSPRPQTTRNRILGIHRTRIDTLAPPGVELCFVDTPGIQLGKGALRRFMRDQALNAATECDVALYVADASDPRGRTPDRLAQPDAADLLGAVAGIPLVVALNKVDRVNKPDLLPAIETWVRWGEATGRGALQVVPIAALEGDGVGRLVATIAEMLPVGPAMFPADMVTDRAEEFLAGELIREQLYHQLGKELPYAAAVIIETFEERDRGDLAIGAAIVVERDSQKAIVIGKGGSRIKQLGIAARQALADLFRCPVHLNLFVKVVPDWSNAEAGLRKVGFADLDGGGGRS
ncbi:MAG: GTPase Era [Deltaproteobacteria bacterium]|nr:GTPase Era [Kofleriaceae bacterium]